MTRRKTAQKGAGRTLREDPWSGRALRYRRRRSAAASRCSVSSPPDRVSHQHFLQYCSIKRTAKRKRQCSIWCMVSLSECEKSNTVQMQCETQKVSPHAHRRSFFSGTNEEQFTLNPLSSDPERIRATRSNSNGLQILTASRPVEAPEDTHCCLFVN